METKNLLDALTGELESAKPGDIATMAEVLHQVETARDSALGEQLPIISAVLSSVGDLVKKIIMEAVSDTAKAFETATQAVVLVAQKIVEGDLTSLDGFSEQLNLPAMESMAPASTQEKASVELVDDAIVAEFLDQHSNSVEVIEANILRLEHTDDAEAKADVKRAMHTIKGESGFLNLPDVEMVCHAAETYLEEAVCPYEIELLLDVNDWLKSALNDMGAGQPISRKAEEMLPRLKSVQVSAASDYPAEEPPSEVPLSEKIADGSSPAGEESAETLTAEASGDQASPSEPVTDAPAEIENALVLGDPHAISDDQLTPPDGFWRLTVDASLLTDFVSESKDHMEIANGELLNLESDPTNQEALNSVFRAFHTIKGIASFLELHEIRILAHDAENLLDNMRKGSLEVSHELVDVAFDSMDKLTALIGKVREAVEGDGTLKPEPGLRGLLENIRAAARGEVRRAEPEETTESKLGEILVEDGLATEEEVQEALVQESEDPSGKKLGEILVESEKVAPKDVASALRRQKPAEASAEQPARPTTGGVEMKETIRVDYDRLESMVDTIGELVIAESMITQDELILEITSDLVDKKIHNLRVISRKLQELGTTIRMVPISGTFQKMARLVRDLTKKSGKNIVYRTTGDETELDRAYVDKIGDPLVHMVRNSVDHGIETPQERAQTDKDPVATITLRAYHEGGNIIVEIQDDGRGINKERVREKALEKGLITEEDRLSDQELFHLIFHPGFSTAAQVTDVSGRGVGMDVVKRNIEDLRGQIVVHSEVGVGSTFKLVLPLTMALIDGMMVGVGGERFIIPVMAVIETFKAETEMLHSLAGHGEMISLRNRQLPFYRLSRMFDLSETEDAVADGLVVVVENNSGKQIGLLVDELIGLQQTVIKNLGSGLGQAEGVAGGAIMADGRIGLILDTTGLFKVAAKVGSGASNVRVEEKDAGNGAEQPHEESSESEPGGSDESADAGSGETGAPDDGDGAVDIAAEGGVQDILSSDGGAELPTV